MQEQAVKRPSRKSRISELLRARQQIDAELAELRSSELPAFELDNRQLLERLLETAAYRHRGGTWSRTSIDVRKSRPTRLFPAPFTPQ